MWTPANNLEWQREGVCARPENRNKMDWFFSKEPDERHGAKNMCFLCPVRSECLQWALEHKQVWGTWGGRDELEIRRALSVSHEGEEVRRRRFPNCPHCGAWPSHLSVSVEKLPGGGRWTTAKIVTCSKCEFSWRSRTSANAVNAYHSEKSESKKTGQSPQ